MSMTRVEQIGHVIILCDDLDRMKAFYRELLAFPEAFESATGLTFRAGSIFLGLRKRTRGYDGRGVRKGLPGVQIAFLVTAAEVDLYHQRLMDQGVEILDSPNNQPWGHRTVYFSDPEGNLLEIYGELVHENGPLKAT
jgi:catechol 2,3-dioxygenase-like lactoylglutathione lyase family enzyme